VRARPTQLRTKIRAAEFTNPELGTEEFIDSALGQRINKEGI